jgi:hypothetical protein
MRPDSVPPQRTYEFLRLIALVGSQPDTPLTPQLLEQLQRHVTEHPYLLLVVATHDSFLNHLHVEKSDSSMTFSAACEAVPFQEGIYTTSSTDREPGHRERNLQDKSEVRVGRDTR